MSSSNQDIPAVTYILCHKMSAIRFAKFGVPQGNIPCPILYVFYRFPYTVKVNDNLVNYTELDPRSVIQALQRESNWVITAMTHTLLFQT